MSTWAKTETPGTAWARHLSFPVGWADLTVYTWAELSAYTWAQLAGLWGKVETVAGSWAKVET